MTFEEIDACAKDLFSKENDASMWASIDEGDRAYWRKMAVEELEERRRSDGDATRGFVDLPDRRFFLLDTEEYDSFANRVDNPQLPGPALRALMKRRPLWQR